MQQNIEAVVGTIAAAYFASHRVDPSEIAKTLREIRKGLVDDNEMYGRQETERAPAVYPYHQERHEPAPQRQSDYKTQKEISKSLADPDFIVSFLDGKPYKTLKRHLGLKGFTPETYREHFGLPPSYPMTAATYSQQRKEVALALGLGRKS